MTIIKRTCATCASFNPAPIGDDPKCWNLFSFTELHGTPQAVTRQPLKTDTCDDHQTSQEDEMETTQIEELREAGGMELVLQSVSSITIARDAVRRAQH